MACHSYCTCCILCWPSKWLHCGTSQLLFRPHAAGDLPDLPRTLHKPSARAAAYARAGLAHWAVALTDGEEPAEVASNVQQQRQAPAAGQRDEPSMVVAVSLAGLVVTLPYDQEPGPSERFVELWAKAFKQVGIWRRQQGPACMHPSWGIKHCATPLLRKKGFGR